jgi:hypothetical protein
MMKKIVFIVVIALLSCRAYSQEVLGQWYIINYSNPDVEEYSEVYWEFTSNGKCLWKLVDDNSIIFEFSYSISHTTCDDGINDVDLHLKLVNFDDGEKLCYVFKGITNENGRITMSINEYEKAEPILFLKR